MNRQSLLKAGPALDTFLEEFESCAVAPTRRLIAAYVRGQLGPLPRKSIMPMAVEAGIPPRTLQELLSLHRWDEDRMVDLLQQRVRRRESPCNGIVVQSACAKRGIRTPGVERQRHPGSERPEICVLLLHLLLQDGPFVSILDTELYLPRSWAADPVRCRQSGIPAGTEYRAKSRIAVAMLGRARSNGLRFHHVLLDREVAGDEVALAALEAGRQRYVAEAEAGLRGWPRSEETVTTAERAVARAGYEAIELEGRAWEAAACTFRVEQTGRPGPGRRLVSLRPLEDVAPRFYLVDLQGGGSVREIAAAALGGGGGGAILLAGAARAGPGALRGAEPPFFEEAFHPLLPQRAFPRGGEERPGRGFHRERLNLAQ